MRHIPSWVPWFNYESLARIGRELSLRTMNEPINFVKSAMVVLIVFLVYDSTNAAIARWNCQAFTCL